MLGILEILLTPVVGTSNDAAEAERVCAVQDMVRSTGSLYTLGILTYGVRGASKQPYNDQLPRTITNVLTLALVNNAEAKEAPAQMQPRARIDDFPVDLKFWTEVPLKNEKSCKSVKTSLTKSAHEMKKQRA